MNIACSTCLESFTSISDISTTSCGHVFHTNCIKKWMENGSNQCPQCRKGFSSPGNLSLHIKGVHGPKKECSYCHKMINSVYINRHIREAHMGDTRMQEADRVVQVLRAHAGGPLRIQGKVPSMWKRNISQLVGTTHQRSSR